MNTATKRWASAGSLEIEPQVPELYSFHLNLNRN